MKIAQVAPLYESVPPKYYGGFRTRGVERHDEGDVGVNVLQRNGILDVVVLK